MSCQFYLNKKKIKAKNVIVVNFMLCIFNYNFQKSRFFTKIWLLTIRAININHIIGLMRKSYIHFSSYCFNKVSIYFYFTIFSQNIMNSTCLSWQKKIVSNQQPTLCSMVKNRGIFIIINDNRGVAALISVNTF